MGITPIMEFAKDYYGKHYAPNTRETVRRMTMHQFVQAGLALYNPDDPNRAVNSPKAVYQIEPEALKVIRSFGEPQWNDTLERYRSMVVSLRQKYAANRRLNRIPVSLPDGKSIDLSPGGQNVLVKEILENFAPRFCPAARPLYVGDTGEKLAFVDEGLAKQIGIPLDLHSKIPDVILYLEDKDWLILIEAVTSHGPVNPKRHAELKAMFGGLRPGLVFITTFLTRRDFAKYVSDIAWETEVWVSEAPDHMVHFNGERFLGPYADT